MTQVEIYLENARKQLLDLSLRNRLLNYRPTKNRTLRVHDESIRELYDILVIQGKTMQFHPVGALPKSSASDSSPDISETAASQDAGDETGSSIWKLPDSEEDLPSHLTDLFLETKLEKEPLQKRLFYISNEAASIVEEQGYTVLYLALGFLEWTDGASPVKSVKSPLVLVPVELTREKIQTAFKIRWTGEDIGSNISLQEKLKELGVSLPNFEMPEDKLGVDTYVKQIESAISQYPQWKILDDTYLDFFSFKKFVMYKDLDSSTWPDGNKPSGHPVMQILFNPDVKQETGPGFSDQDVDVKITSESSYHILDADSSQIAVIEDIKADKNLVVEGPPGTGKSQTIANAIAENLAMGKSVLFISEKMAALEVVKNRLDAIGLGPFCLELHSKNSTKTSFIQELQRTVSMQEPSGIEPGEQLKQLDQLKLQLNAYAQALRTPVGSRSKTPYELFGQKEQSRCYFQSLGREFLRVPLPGIENCPDSEWTLAKESLQNAAEIFASLNELATLPWHGCNPGLLLPIDNDELLTMIRNAKISSRTLQENINELVPVTGIRPPSSIRELKNSLDATRLIISQEPIDTAILRNEGWNAPDARVTALINAIFAFNEENSRIGSIFNADIYRIDTKLLRSEFRSAAESNVLSKLFSGNYRQLKSQVTAYYQRDQNRSDEEILTDLDRVTRCQELRSKIRAHRDTGVSFFGSLWNDEQSDASGLQRFSEWISSFRSRILENVFTDRTIEILSKGADLQRIGACVAALQHAITQFEGTRDILFTRLQCNGPEKFKSPIDAVLFSELDNVYEDWENAFPFLDSWCRYTVAAEKCRKTMSAPVLQQVENKILLSTDAVPCLMGNDADILLRSAFTQLPALANFYSGSHLKTIESFQALDRQYIRDNRSRLATKLYAKIPKLYGGISKDSEMGILIGEFNRKKNHMPIRKLMTEAGGLIQKIKPCFMMSPLSVAQFLDPRTVRFNVIIFDEASQVRPQDALGAILRGNQAVVIGDSRQLPPTSFFEKLIEMGDDTETIDDSPLPSDMESILDLCKMRFTTKILSWHYRSRHESLIAVSNEQFYDNHLFVYPSPMSRTDDIGLKFVYCADTVYDRGKTRLNREEAKIVSRAAIDHFKQYPDKSLGVGTFSTAQQQAIIEEIEAARIQNPGMEDFFTKARAEPFFVKNLETIQGDERDVIFISVGYGKDKNGILTTNFGPLNVDGGERRLNVLITRARECCVVFSNFRSSDLVIDTASSFGVRAFKEYLSYAETGVMISSSLSEGDQKSPFEESVYNFLRDHGYQVRKQIGCAGFRIDLAIADPSAPGEFILGIECDGAMYYSSRVARDRDRLRQQVLEGLGWKLYRVWSTDWYRDPGTTQEQLMAAVNRAINTPGPAPLVKKEPVIAMQPEINASPGEDAVGVPPASATNGSVFDKIPAYIQCTKEMVDCRTEFDDTTDSNLVANIKIIVDIEGPVHRDECIARLKNFYGLKRVSPKIRGRIEEIIKSGVDHGLITAGTDNFLWPKKRPVTILRRRVGGPGNISVVCNEEIEEAVMVVLKEQFSTGKEDLCVVTARIFGITRAKGDTLERVSSVVDSLISNGQLEILPNGKIDRKQKE